MFGIKFVNLFNEHYNKEWNNHVVQHILNDTAVL